MPQAIMVIVMQVSVFVDLAIKMLMLIALIVTRAIVFYSFALRKKVTKIL